MGCRQHPEVRSHSLARYCVECGQPITVVSGGDLARLTLRHRPSTLLACESACTVIDSEGKLRAYSADLRPLTDPLALPPLQQKAVCGYSNGWLIYPANDAVLAIDLVSWVQGAGPTISRLCDGYPICSIQNSEDNSCAIFAEGTSMILRVWSGLEVRCQAAIPQLSREMRILPPVIQGLIRLCRCLRRARRLHHRSRSKYC